ncbi:PIN domain-containing protein [Methylobacterium sp. BTF04]|uniref:PIN domain-containing protein n=1 Tax=Methylobacterium sp. BTF04 TaxID=2708300 RepID=UPI0013D2C436|nr:PIN domain-containing protein [Methylobacterium sp. BTF04]
MIVVDVNVVLSGLRSRNGAPHVVLRGMLTGRYAFAASPAMVLEYEAVVKRPGLLGPTPWIEAGGIDTILDALCATAVPIVPWFRFRPFLDDPKDDLYVECALAAEAATIVTHDRHFRHPAVAALGLRAVTPQTLIET